MLRRVFLAACPALAFGHGLLLKPQSRNVAAAAKQGCFFPQAPGACTYVRKEEQYAESPCEWYIDKVTIPVRPLHRIIHFFTHGA